ncbi:hypothetical protein CLU79DRAFT_837706 [Phycomyces nitens]|nr:hypothetical protein CLU79DRAFT_837706 [Phycomyces nitens]
MSGLLSSVLSDGSAAASLLAAIPAVSAVQSSASPTTAAQDTHTSQPIGTGQPTATNSPRTTSDLIPRPTESPAQQVPRVPDRTEERPTRTRDRGQSSTPDQGNDKKTDSDTDPSKGSEPSPKPRPNKTVFTSSGKPVVAVTSSGTMIITYTSTSYVVFPTTIASPDSQRHSNSRAHTRAAVVGGVIGVVVLLCLIVLLGCLIMKRKKSKRSSDFYTNAKGDGIFYPSPLHESHGDYIMEASSMKSGRPMSLANSASTPKQVRAFVAPPPITPIMETTVYPYQTMPPSPNVQNVYYEDSGMRGSAYGQYPIATDHSVHQNLYQTVNYDQQYYAPNTADYSSHGYYQPHQEMYTSGYTHNVPHSRD